MTQTKKDQQGAALIVALIMLVMVTLLAVTASRFTLLGTRTSFNYQIKNTAFQAAEVGISRGIEFISSGDAHISIDAVSGQQTISEFTPAPTSLAAGDFTSTLNYSIRREESVIDNGSSLGEGKALPTIYRYAIDSTATVNGHNAVSQIEQGYGALRFSE